MSTTTPLPSLHLTPRELEVLSHLPLHKSAREIADDTFVSVNTVRSHVKSIYVKLGVTNRTAAIRMAQQLGFLPATDHHSPASPMTTDSLMLAVEARLRGDPAVDVDMDRHTMRRMEVATLIGLKVLAAMRVPTPRDSDESEILTRSDRMVDAVSRPRSATATG